MQIKNVNDSPIKSGFSIYVQLGNGTYTSI